MCCNLNLFHVSDFKFLCISFIKFIVHEIKFEIIKSKMVVLIGRENTDIADADVTVSWML
jgi:hypothetical protein